MENELEPHPSDDIRQDAVATAPAAPGVVAALVVHSPTDQLGDTLDSLSAQDYPNLQVLVLLTGSDAHELAMVTEMVDARSLAAHVRHVGANPGFATVANSVSRLVQGDSGFFLFLHDDVALDPDAVRLMVEELYRSNAGLVGPKIVEWDDPRRLHMVGFDADRFGELDGAIEEHEVDQEQHDAVRDVFVLPTACLLVRADLFREMGGFEESIPFHGEDLDLCWRAHLMGARVVVAPVARVRHRGNLRQRRDDLSHVKMAARHRLSTVASLTGVARSFTTIPLLILVTLVEAIVSLVTGHVRRALFEVGALVTAPRDTMSILRRRRRVAALRRIPDREVADLQVRGSVRWRRLVRGRHVAGVSPGDRGVSGDDTVSRDPVTIVVWFVLWGLLLAGARELIAGGIGSVGDLLPWAESPRDVAHSYLSGWWGKDLGATTAQPTGNILMFLAGVLTLGHPALAQTIAVVGLVAAGWLGASRLCAVASAPRARLIGTIAYAAIPLPYAAVAAGRLQALIAYAVLPWALHLMRLFGGLGLPRGVEESSRTVGDVIDHPDTTTRVRIVSSFALLMGVTAAFAPSVMLVVLVCAVLWVVAALLSGGSLRAAGLGIAAVLVSMVA
ncbi:MAG: glycosyltransferase, partial [Actinobacteria bacterium]|nr:glycosyltransferase [Actinomycetota bacterium]